MRYLLNQLTMICAVLFGVILYFTIPSWEQAAWVGVFDHRERPHIVGICESKIGYFTTDVTLGPERRLTWDSDVAPPADLVPHIHQMTEDADDKASLNRWGYGLFRLGDGAFGWNQHEWYALFMLPAWLVLTLLGILPALFLARQVRFVRRWYGGKCMNCGYDLRYSVDRCPECGTSINPKQPKTGVHAEGDIASA